MAEQQVLCAWPPNAVQPITFVSIYVHQYTEDTKQTRTVAGETHYAARNLRTLPSASGLLTLN